MKIAWVVHDFDLRFGQGRYSVEIARRLAERHQVFVFSNTFGVDLEPGLAFQRVPAARSTSISTILTFAYAADRMLRNRNFDIVHTQGFTCQRADVITAHICNAARKKRVDAQPARSRLFYQLIPALERRFYQRTQASQLIAISNGVAAEIRACYGWNKACTTIYHGTDIGNFRPATKGERAAVRRRFGLPNDGWIWLFVGEAAKGLSAVIEQLASFPTALLLVVSRSGIQPYRRLAEALGVAARVRFAGVHDDMAGAYHAADTFVYPSGYDAFGLVVAEAMSSGLPVVVSRQTGAAEWIRHRENGLLIDAKNAKELENELRWLQNHPDAAQEIGRHARLTVQDHTWDQCAKQVLAVYEQAFGSRRPS